MVASAQDQPSTGAIYGTVLDAEQAVVGEVQLEVVSGPSGVGIVARSRGRDSVMYDGGFFIPNLAPGTYAAKASHKKFFSKTYEDIEVEAGKGTYLVVELQPIADIAGKIYGTVKVNGASVAGLVIGYLQEDAKRPEESVELGEDGNYNFENVMPETYVVVITKDREEIYRSDPIKVSEKKAVKHNVRLAAEVLLEKPGSIKGRVLGSDRKPVSNASISLIKMPEGQGKASARSDSEGRFEIKELRPGSYELKASKGREGEDTARTYVRSERTSSVTFYLKKP